MNRQAQKEKQTTLRNVFANQEKKLINNRCSSSCIIPPINANYTPSLETREFSFALFIEDTCLLAVPFSLFSTGQIRQNITVYHISWFSTTTYLEGQWKDRQARHKCTMDISKNPSYLGWQFTTDLSVRECTGAR